MKITPTKDNVLVKLDAMETTFEGGSIVRPDIARDKPRMGTVLCAGEGTHRFNRVTRKQDFIPTTLEPGDRVFVEWGTGHDMMIGNDLCVFIREADIKAVEE